MNKKIILTVFTLLSINYSFGQLFITQNGETSFFSDTPLENISAKNNQVAAILNISTGEIAVKISMTQFKFPNKLMQEHFNENYVESSKYPFATFKGKINDIGSLQKDGTFDVSTKGILEVHGIKQERTLKGKLTINKSQILLESNFDIKLIDHKIDIPTIVFAKIAENIAVKNKWTFMVKK